MVLLAENGNIIFADENCEIKQLTKSEANFYIKNNSEASFTDLN